MTVREKLLTLLAPIRLGNGCGLSEAEAHREAERLLLEIVADPEVTEAWNEAADFWWYA